MREKGLYILFNGIISEDSISGGDQLILDLVKNLPTEVKTVVILPEKARKYWDKLNLKNSQVYSIPNWFFDRSQNPFFVLLTYLRRTFLTYQFLLVEKENIAVIYSCSDVVLGDIIPAFLFKGLRWNSYWISRNYHLILPPWKRQGNFLINLFAFWNQRIHFWLMRKRSDKVLALNKAVYKDLLKLGFDEKRLGVLGAGVEVEEIKKYKPKKKYAYQAVVLGRIHPVKGVFDLVEIWKKVVKEIPPAKLALIGSGAAGYINEVKERIGKAKLEKNIDLLGFIPKESVLDIMKSAQIFLCPDHENGWGLAVCEAMAAGLPVVSYDIDIFGAVYKKGFVSVPLFDTDTFAQRVVYLLENKKARTLLAKKALGQAGTYDNKAVVRGFLALLKEIERN